MSLSRRRPRNATLLYFGDSHAYAFCSPTAPPPHEQERILPVGPGEFLCWLGPRLMYSVGKNGVPEAVVRQTELLAERTGNLVIVWFLGEIDIRVFGTTRYLGRPDAVHAVVDSFLECATRTFPTCRHYITIPTAPSNVGRDDPALPRTGSLEERLEVLGLFREHLRQSVAHSIFDPNVLNSGPALSSKETGDGCHFRFLHALRLRTLLHAAVLHGASRPARP